MTKIKSKNLKRCASQMLNASQTLSTRYNFSKNNTLIVNRITQEKNSRYNNLK